MLTCSAKVTDVAPSDFSKAISSSRVALVLFYTTWCGHSRQFAPEFEYASELIEEANVAQTFRVDVTHNTTLVQSLGIKGYPSVVLFIDGDMNHPILYDADLATPSAILVWTTKRSSSTVALAKTVADAKNILKRSSFAFFAFDNEATHPSHPLHAVAKRLGEVEFVLVDSESVAKAVGLSKEVTTAQGIFYFPHEFGRAYYHGLISDGPELIKFLESYRLPILTKLTPSTVPAVLKDSRVKVLLVGADSLNNTDSVNTLRSQIMELASSCSTLDSCSEFRSNYLLTESVPGSATSARLAEFLGPFDGLWLLDGLWKFRCVKTTQKDGNKTIFDFGETSSVALDVHACIEAYEAGELLRFFKSNTGTSFSAAFPNLPFVSAKKLSEIHTLGTVAVFVTPWCSACVELLKSVNEIEGDVVIVDVSVNDTPGIDVVTYPAVGVLKEGGWVLLEGQLDKEWLRKERQSVMLSSLLAE